MADDAFAAVDERLFTDDAIPAARKLFASDRRLAFLFEAVVLRGRTMKDAARSLGVSASCVEQLVKREIVPALRHRFSKLDA